MPAVVFRDRYQSQVTGVPGTGTITLGSTTIGNRPFINTDDALLFDILITDGTAWEICTECTYTFSGTSITRGTFVSSSTGTTVALTSNAIVSVVLLAERTVPFYVDTPTSTNYLKQNELGQWTNADITEINTLTGGISIADFVVFDTVNEQQDQVGKLNWDQTNGTLNLGLAGANVNLAIGQSEVSYVYNHSGVYLSTGQVVFVSGAQGNTLSVELAQANTEVTSFGAIGVVAEPIAIGGTGYITTSGLITKLNTLGLAEGSAIWLDPNVAGGFTVTKPTAPNHLVLIGYIVREASINGTIYIKVQNGYELDELHNVLISATPTTGQVLTYNSGTAIWSNQDQAGTPPQAGHAAQFLTTNGSTTSWASGGNVVPFTTSTGATNNIPLSGVNNGDSLSLATSLTLGTAAKIYTGNANYGWKDITSDINVKGGGGNNPAWGVFQGGINAYTFLAGLMNECWVTFHINHDYALGTPIYFHTHWSNPGVNTGVVRWGFEYTIAKGHQQMVFPATTTVYVEQAAVAQYEHQIAEIATGISSANLEPDSLILVRVFRDAAHVNDTCTNSVCLFASGIHYQANTFATKNKAPNFYA